MRSVREQLARLINPAGWELVDETGITEESDPIPYRTCTATSLDIADRIIQSGWTPPPALTDR